MAIISDEEQSVFGRDSDIKQLVLASASALVVATYSVAPPGCGTFVAGGKSYAAHKLSYLITHGDITKGLWYAIGAAIVVALTPNTLLLARNRRICAICGFTAPTLAPLVAV